MKMLKRGDLCHIPQDVSLWATNERGVPNYSIKTTTPTTALIIEAHPDTVLLFMDGHKLHARRRHIYPYAPPAEVPVG